MTQPAPPVQLFSRAFRITVGTVQVSGFGQQIGLSAWFSVRRSLKPREPNTCDLRLYNLADDTRRKIEQSASPVPSQASAPGSSAKVVPVKIEAGYVGNIGTIFLGEMRSGQTTTDGATTIVEITTGDGDEATLLARSTSSFGPGSNAFAVAQQLLKDMGCGVGNIATVQSILQSTPVYAKGKTVKRNSLRALVALASSCGLEVSVQGGVAQWTTLGQPLAGQAYSLSSDTGLIGSPSVDTKGVLTLEMLMAPGIRPGAAISMNAKYVQGLFRITSVETTGDTAGADWSHKVEAKRYGTTP